MTPQPQEEEIFMRILLQEIKKKEFKPYMNHPKKAVWFEDIDNIVREQFRSRPAPSPPTEYFITHDINCGEYSSTIAVASPEKPIQIDDQTVKVGGITIRFDSEIESIETIDEYGESLRTGGEPR